MQKTLARFEEYREIVKIKASKLPKKHPRCLADGNELLRFHGTTIACSLGMNGSSSLCTSDKCSVCRILRHGFSTKKEVNGGVGVFTTSTSGSAFESIKLNEEIQSLGRALIVCRVIAGRVHRPLENIQELAGQSGFDSLAGKVGVYSNIEELYLLNPIALLPCFVVICKPWNESIQFATWVVFVNHSFCSFNSIHDWSLESSHQWKLILSVPSSLFYKIFYSSQPSPHSIPT